MTADVVLVVILLDVLAEDPQWSSWSAEALARSADEEALAINPIIDAEVSIRFATIEELEEALTPHLFELRALPWEAAFLAGKCFLKYRRREGRGGSPLPDFYIGAHAAVEGMALLTRDATRYRTYFPNLRLIAP
jgi:predicted nucleic acid-binding protein